VQRQVRLKIVSEDDTHVHPAKGIKFNPHPSTAHCRRDSASPIGVAPTRQHLSQPGKRVRIPKEYNVETLASEQAGGGTGRALSAGTIQHFDLYPLRRTHGSSRDRRRRGRPGKKDRRGDEAYRPRR
jgi:hypothetical protein